MKEVKGLVEAVLDALTQAPEPEGVVKVMKNSYPGRYYP